MSILDIIVAPLFLLIIYIFAFRIKKKKYAGSPVEPYFIPALTAKIIGAITSGLIYQFYYKGGDALNYYHGAGTICNYFMNDPIIGFRILFSDSNDYSPEVYEYLVNIFYFFDPNTFFVVKITAILGLFSFNLFSVIEILFACISFWANWKLYLCVCEMYPKIQKQLAITILFVPSVIFWGSGIFKDTVTFIAICLLTFGFFELFFKKNFKFKTFLIFFIAIFFLYKIRGFFLMIIVPCYLLWLAMALQKNIKIKFIRLILAPAIITAAIYGGYLLILNIQETLGKYSFEKLETTAKGFQLWHSYLQEKAGGSGYSLGSVDYSFQGIISKIPLAINVTFFRPYLWEVHNVIAFISGLESFFVLVLTLRLFIRNGIFKPLVTIYNNPYVSFAVLFSLIFAFVVGFTSYNFGALVRYKIPCMPFYISSIFIIEHLIKLKRGQSELAQ